MASRCISARCSCISRYVIAPRDFDQPITSGTPRFMYCFGIPNCTSSEVTRVKLLCYKYIDLTGVDCNSCCMQPNPRLSHDRKQFSIFSSAEHKVLMVSFCDRPMSGVRRPSSVVRRPSSVVRRASSVVRRPQFL